jgi:hypothetical protein
MEQWARYLSDRHSLRNDVYLRSFNHFWLKTHRLCDFDDELIFFSLMMIVGWS